MIRRPPRSTLFPYTTLFRSIAAPTAGLHFAPEILEKIRARGGEICELTLDIGLGTFQPIHSETLERSEEHTSELQSRSDLVCRLLLEKKKQTHTRAMPTLLK